MIKNTKIIPAKSEWIHVGTGGIDRNCVFAAKDIPKGTRIIQYGGEKITKTEALKRIEAAEKKAERTGKPVLLYIFDLNKRWDLDGDVSWNVARFINHSCEPNCESEDDEEESSL